MFRGPYALLWAGPFLTPKFTFAVREFRPQSNSWFPGPTRAYKANGTSIGSAVFAGLKNVTDRQTDTHTQTYHTTTGVATRHILCLAY